MLKNDTHRLLDERINAQRGVLLIFYKFVHKYA